MEGLREWNPVNLEKYYISPGIIDLDVDLPDSPTGIEETTKKAVSGGVTVVWSQSRTPDEDNFLDIDQDLYCDVGKIQVLSDEPLQKLDIGENTLALKTHLENFVWSLQSVAQNREAIRNHFESTSKHGLPLFVDVSIKNKSWKSSKTSHLKYHRYTASLGEIPEIQEQKTPIDPMDSYSEDEEEEFYTNPIKRSTSCQVLDNTKEETKKFKTQKEFLDTKVREAREEQFPKFKAEDFRDNIHLDLKKRIYRAKRSIQAQSDAERSSYNFVASSKSVDSSPIDAQKPMSLLPVRCRTMDLQPISEIGQLQWPEPQVIRPRGNSNPSQGNLSPGGINEGQARLSKFRVGLAPIQTKPVEQVPQVAKYINWISQQVRDPEFEGLQILKPILNNFTSTSIHLSNISEPQVLSVVRKIRKHNSKLTVDVPIHNLYFSDGDVPDQDIRFKEWPPIRSNTYRDLLWEWYKLNYIPTVTSHHSSISKESSNDFFEAESGINSIGFALPAMWTRLKGDLLTDSSQYRRYLVRLAQNMSTIPAKILGIESKRGSIASGKRADLIVWRPDKLMKFSTNESPYAQQWLYGRITSVFIAGQMGFWKGETWPYGRLLYRKYETN